MLVFAVGSFHCYIAVSVSLLDRPVDAYRLVIHRGVSDKRPGKLLGLAVDIKLVRAIGPGAVKNPEFYYSILDNKRVDKAVYWLVVKDTVDISYEL